MEDQQINSNKSELWNISVKDLFFKYVRFLPFFLLSVAIMLFAAYIYLRYSTDIYAVRGTNIIKNQNNNKQDKLDELFMSNNNRNIQDEMEIIRSRPLMARVVKALNIQTAYFAKGRFKSTELYTASPLHLDIFMLKDTMANFSISLRFVNDHEFYFNKEAKPFALGQVFENNYGVFRLNGDSSFHSDQEFVIRYKSLPSISSELAAKINVQPKSPGTGLLTISMETPTPQMGADIINQLMIEYAKRSVEVKNLTALQTLEFIDSRLDKLGHEIDSIEKIKLAFQQKNDLIDVSAQSESYFSSLSESNQALNLQIDKLNTAQMVDAYLKDKKNEHEPFNLVPSALGLEDVTLNGLIQSYNIAQLERKSLLDGGTTIDNPLIKKKEGDINEIRQRLLENLSNIMSAYGNQIRKAKDQSQQIQSQLKMIPEKARGLLEIDQVLEGKQTLFKFLSEKREETAISQASTIPDSDILDTALVPSSPVKPNRRTIQLLAILIGLAIPALYIFISEVLNDKITTRFDIEKITRAAVLGEVGHSFAQDSSLVVSSTNRSMVAEQFRIIRSNLQYVTGNIERPVILVTSSFSGEGKSFISTNLAAVMALAGKKTIVLEFDIRKPKIMSGLKLQQKIGITNFLLGKSEMADLPILVPGYQNLFVLPCGPVPPNPSELLLESKVAELFDYLKKNFEAIIIDTAPVGMVSDAMTLSKFADCTLYIVRQGHTFKKQIILIDEFYTESKLPKLSIVINDVKLKPGYGYYGYGRYGYGYGYGSGYYEEEAPPKTTVDKLIEWLDPRNWLRWFKRK
ncbi:MAG: polysaccharide biosynthesis tyrosine autokinase [Bacteroidetes bacterium]|nr:polysaccharide biosynthesis tyrosine autokinase [Bacteroidota bacterium]MBS1609046.1 polysaccharide biosynthesis tyrosine autokinase [Bacteroidota bacterium]